VAYRLRNRSPFQKVATTMVTVPLTLGTVLIAEGMLTYFGPRGWFSQAVQALALWDGPVRLTHNYWGVLISLVISGFPFAFLLTLSYITGIDPALPRAAATLGAPPWQQFRTSVAAAAQRPGDDVLPGLRAGVLGVSIGGAAGGAGRADAGDLHRGLRGGVRGYDYSLASAIAMVMGMVQLGVVAHRAHPAQHLLPRPRRRGQGLTAVDPTIAWPAASAPAAGTPWSSW
jgi:putative spermidine/putrescine transport system permease protein